MKQKSTPTVRLEREPHREADHRLHTAYEKLWRAYRQRLVNNAEATSPKHQESDK